MAAFRCQEGLCNLHSWRQFQQKKQKGKERIRARFNRAGVCHGSFFLLASPTLRSRQHQSKRPKLTWKRISKKEKKRYQKRQSMAIGCGVCAGGRPGGTVLVRFRPYLIGSQRVYLIHLIIFSFTLFSATAGLLCRGRPFVRLTNTHREKDPEHGRIGRIFSINFKLITNC